MRGVVTILRASRAVARGDIPEKEKLDDIWAYMNFHLNFKKLLSENREKKLLQKYKYVKNITDLVSPENCLALYFLGYLEKTIFGSVDSNTIRALEQRLEIHSYWQERFEQYKLSAEHLKSEQFNFEKIDKNQIIQSANLNV